MGHEMEHVNHEQARAQEEDRTIVAQYVQIHTAVCPECGRTFVAGGTTTTVTGSKSGESYANKASGALGRSIDTTV
jgi:hypothetical protein